MGSKRLERGDRGQRARKDREHPERGHADDEEADEREDADADEHAREPAPTPSGGFGAARRGPSRQPSPHYTRGPSSRRALRVGIGVIQRRCFERPEFRPVDEQLHIIRRGAADIIVEAELRARSSSARAARRRRSASSSDSIRPRPICIWGTRWCLQKAPGLPGPRSSDHRDHRRLHRDDRRSDRPLGDPQAAHLGGDSRERGDVPRAARQGARHVHARAWSSTRRGSPR